MGSIRGAANLARFNAERSAHLIPALEDELRKCSKRKLTFGTVGQLAAFLADRLGVHRTTLLRNAKYKGRLLAYLAGAPGVVLRTPDSTSDPAILQAKLMAAKVSASNLREELAACKAKLERHSTALHPDLPIDSAEVAFVDLAMVLVNILHRFPDFVRLDRDRLEMVDLSAKPSARVLAGRERLGRFVRWLELNQALPSVKALVLTGA